MQKTKIFLSCLALAVMGAAVASAQTCVSLTTMGSAYTQNFNTLASSGTSSTLPTGWAFVETGTNANTTYSAGTGSSTTGDTYSFGAAASSERALGTLLSGSLTPTIGACFVNNTGAVVQRLTVSYTGEQWRLGQARNLIAPPNDFDRLAFQYSTNATSLSTGTYTSVAALDFRSPVNVPGATALDGNNAANRANITSTILNTNIADGATFWIRWTDFNVSGSDDGLAVDDFSLTPLVNPGLSISDISVTEGTGGTSTAALTVTLSEPAPAGGITFDIATADGSAIAPGDYTAKSLNNQSIPEGSTSYAFNVDIVTDSVFEVNENFTVALTNITGGVIVTKSSATVTILNDDEALISQIQGSGASSPVVGASVATRGIVTALRSNGFFIQSPPANVDADPATSEGIFVFTGGAPPGTALVGNLVRVTGTVTEFIPTADPQSPSVTELTSPVVTLVSTGQTLPQPVTLTIADTTNAVLGLNNLERFEGMRVRVESLTVVGPTLGTTNENNATGSSSGVFYGVITGVPRPFREPGVQVPDALPAGSPCCVPRFDANPERIRVDSDAQPGTSPIDVTAGATVVGLVGPLDYSFRTYTILPDLGTPTSVTGNISPTPAAAPTASQFTVASFNMERFFDTVNDDGISDVALTAAAYDKRLSKASQAIRLMLRTPDILGVQEIENLGALQDIANRTNADAIAASQPNPMYTAHLVEGNDPGGIDVGFLVKTSRVTVVSVTQEGKTTMYTPPGGAPAILNDRPPLLLQASVAGPGGTESFPVTVINNHLRSLNDVADPTDGARVRAKRKEQADFLANLVQTRQTANPNERIVLIGDFNAFPFNDGYADSIGIIRGQPAPANTTVLAGADLVNPDLADAADALPAAQRYSYVFDGNAQTLDHVLLSQSVLPFFVTLDHARMDADFPESYRGNPGPERLSDHDPSMAYFRFPTADLGLTLTSVPAPVAGQTVDYTFTVTNSNLEAALNAKLTASIPAGTGTFASISPAGWTCTTPLVGSAGAVNCSKSSLAASASDAIVITVNILCADANGASVVVSGSVTSDTFDPDLTNNSRTSTTTVSNPPPFMSAVTPSETSLWPPNGKMVDITLSYTASDTPCGGVSCVITVSSNEVTGTVDFEVVDATHLKLRAERLGTGEGRIYTITVTCTDAAGGTTSKSTIVTVPHSQGQN